MVMKIFNWLGSGIFRTIGRIIAYAIIGLIIGFFAVKSDFKISDLFDFDFIVYADSIPTARYRGVYQDGNGQTQYTSWSAPTSVISNTQYYTGIQNIFDFNTNSCSLSHLEYCSVRENSIYSLDFTNTFSPDSAQFLNATVYLYYVAGNDSITIGNPLLVNAQSCRITQGSTSNSRNIHCEFVANANADVVLVSVNLRGGYLTAIHQAQGASYSITNSTNEQITNQTNILNNAINNTTNAVNNTTNAVNGLNNTLKDDNVQADTEDMGDFLNDMTFNKDSSISSILTLPIDFLEDIFMEDYTDDLCFTLKNQQACIPNGKIIWNRSGCHDNSPFGCGTTQLNAFKTFFNLVVGGYICFKLLIGVAKTYDKVLDPLDNGIQVMKL